jgi:hypothetical protein
MIKGRTEPCSSEAQSDAGEKFRPMQICIELTRKLKERKPQFYF